MGSKCTKTTKVIIPNRIIRVTGKSTEPQQKTITETPTTQEPPSKHTTIPSNLKPPERESPNLAQNQNSPSTPRKQGNEINTLNPASPYGKQVLHIGEHYLSGEKERSQASRLKSPIDLNKSMPTPKTQKIDKIINTLRGTIDPAKFKDLASELTTEIDLCIQHYSITQPFKFNKLYSEGLSMKHRWNFWKVRLNPSQYYVKGLYERFQGLHSNSIASIQKDVHRTFPEETYFSAEEFGKIGQSQLFNVLKALSIYFPNLGYVQGMNFLVAFLLLVNGGNEIEAFWMFVAFARNTDFLVMGFFERNLPLLDLYLHIFYEVLNRDMPHLHLHIKSLGIPDTMWISNWFMTVFLYSLPAAKVVRIWDYVLSEDLFGVIKVSLSLLKLYEKELLKMDFLGFNDLIQFFRTEKPIRNPKSSQDDLSFIFSVKEIDIELLIKTAKKMSLSKAQIARYCSGFIEKESKYRNHPYYQFYSDYEANSKNPTVLEEFQREIEFMIIAGHLFENPEVKKKEIIQILEDPIKEEPSMILKDLEIEDIENSSNTRRRDLENVQEEQVEEEEEQGEAEQDADENGDQELDESEENEEREEDRDGITQMTPSLTNKEEESKAESSNADNNPLKHFALKEHGNFDAASWYEKSSYRGSQVGQNARVVTDDYQSEMEEMKSSVKLDTDHVREVTVANGDEITQGQFKPTRPAAKNLNEKSLRFSNNSSIQEHAGKPINGMIQIQIPR